MSTAFWLLLVLLPVFGLIYALWSYRNKTAAKEASSRERIALLVGVTQATRATSSGEIATQGGANQPPVTPATRFLNQPETLAYYLLKAGLPGYEVFPRVSLAAVLTARTSASVVDRATGRQNLDFVICDKTMQVVAAVQLEGQSNTEAMAALGRELNSAGIRLIRFDPV